LGSAEREKFKTRRWKAGDPLKKGKIEITRAMGRKVSPFERVEITIRLRCKLINRHQGRRLNPKYFVGGAAGGPQ